MYERATGSDPFRLTLPWIDAWPHLDLNTKSDFASTDDLVRENPISTHVDSPIGLISDGNIPSLGRDFVHDGSQNRLAAVDTSTILAPLRTMYKTRLSRMSW